MYITADGADVAQETILAPAKSVYGIGGPASVSSDDVAKAGTVVTNTPDGRMRLTGYLTNVEKEIAADLQNKRNKANIRRSRKLRKTIRKNKALAAKNLAHQVSVQQRSMAAH